MTLRSLFIREHDGSDCGSGYCRHDARCSDSHCAGHPQNNEPADDEPESWAVIVGLGSWVALIFAVVAAAAAIAAFSEWSPPYWPRLVLAFNFWS
jgi:hypothetical protein